MALSPMMRQYFSIKENYKDCLLFFRLGDFYEMFFDDAIIASKELDLTLTGRDCGLEERAPMCGVPFHAVDTYIAKLIEKGYKVAICEQTTLPEESKGIVEREVIRIITPGTVIDGASLYEDKNNYIACVYKSDKGIGLSWADISTGELNYLEIKQDILNTLNDTLMRINPAEIICNSEMLAASYELTGVKYNLLPKFGMFLDFAFDYENAYNKFSQGDFLNIDINKKLAVCSTAALLEYLHSTQKQEIKNIHSIFNMEDVQFMHLGSTCRRNLELTETLRERKKRGSLLYVLDKTSTSMGARQLRRWLEQPSLNSNIINKRLNGVEELVSKPLEKDNLAAALTDIRDLERLCTKISFGTANPRDLLAISLSLHKSKNVIECIQNYNSDFFTDIKENIDPVDDAAKLIDISICDNPPILLKDGGFIKEGYNRELDEYRNISKDSKTLLSQLEIQERNATGIKNLKVAYNKVFGFYIEVTRSQLDLVPYRYQRKQTIANGERYITPELKQLEDKILGSEEKAVKLENKLYNEILDALGDKISRIQTLAKKLADIDCIVSLAHVAITNNYCRPKISKDIKSLKIIEGRHPVVEQFLNKGEFVPNDTYLDNDENRTIIITGPNMAGKSTYMRQVALITIMAHMGSFVPAKEAHIPLTDMILTRIGASDDVAFGQSTFMVEMTEMSYIIKNATSSSLLILDEIGRGTATFDGLSIAWAIIEYINQNIKAKTLFATHYHELTELEGILSGVKNYRITVKELNNSIVFLRKIVRGGANKSFGIEVARLAGLPDKIIIKAKDILKNLEHSDINYKATDNSLQIGMFDDHSPKFNQIKNIIQETDINLLTPLQALELLSDLKEKLKKI